ncbi:MAG: rRNA maturation RNase YbeY [Chloroflexi bacterium]|nr:rRNA maturation RNase YbeY [Chloroflexota bacterium]
MTSLDFPGEVGVQVDPAFQEKVKAEKLTVWTARILQHLMLAGELEGIPTPLEMGIAITGDAEIQALNRDYRGQDSPTDILSFSMQSEDDLSLPAGQPFYLGDLIISYPRVESQAAQLGHTPEAELYFLVLHGLLHLVGYDDETEESNLLMWDKQLDLWQQLTQQSEFAFQIVMEREDFHTE